jgi:tetratricopeptide (TPR) repeat protein
VTARTLAAVTLLLLSTITVTAQSAQPRPNPSGATPDRAGLLKQAAVALQAGRTTDAVRLLRVAAEKHQSVQAYIQLARLQSRGGDVEAAMDSLAKARVIAPNSEDVLSAYAQLALAAKRPLPAVLTLEAMTRVYPTVAQYHYLLGVALMAVGDMPSATGALNEANRIEPNRPLTFLALGLTLNNRKMFVEAKPMLERSLELQPDDTDSIAALSETEAGLGELDRAAVLAQRVLERSPSNATANLVMGMVLLERRSYADARDWLLKAADADPDSPKMPYQLSLAYARLGDDANSRRYLDVYREKMRASEERLKALRSGSALTEPARR